MAIDPGTATIIAAGLGAAGNLLGGSSPGWSQQGAYAYDWRKAHQQQRWTHQNMQVARRWALDDQQNQIQRKVADAKAAGLHPLYALGSGSAPGVQALPVTATGGPVFPGQSSTGSFASKALREVGRGIEAYANVPNAYERQMGRYERRLNQRLLESQIRETNARALNAAATSARGVEPGRPTIQETREGVVSLHPVRPQDVRVVSPTVQKPLPPSAIANFAGTGRDIVLSGGSAAGDVEERGGEAMGLVHSIGMMLNSIGRDFIEEMKWFGSFGKYGKDPYKRSEDVEYWRRRGGK